MRFLEDECTGPNVASWLRDNDYEVFSVFDDARGMGSSQEHNKASYSHILTPESFNFSHTLCSLR
jgi:hypothetical protein